MAQLSAAQLKEFAQRLLEQPGTPSDVAEQVATSLVGANLRGHDSHGVRLIPAYLAKTEGDEEALGTPFTIDADARPSVEVDVGSFVVMDGQSAFGQLTASRAADRAIERAEGRGVGIVGIRNATHIGRVGEWAERVADAGMAFLALVSMQGQTEMVAFPGSGQGRIATNPVAFGIPSFDALPFPIVLDMATSQVAFGKVLERHATGEPLPEEWTVAPDGAPVTDPDIMVAGEGALLPLGGRTAGYKGFGLSLMAELFAGVVGGGDVLGQPDTTPGNSAMFVAVDVTELRSVNEIEDQVSALVEYVRSTQYDDDVPAGVAAQGNYALVPGEPEHLVREDRLENGIPIPDAEATSLRKAAMDYSVGDAVPKALRE
jgi:uncharacterized oxidoreductase